MTKAELAQEIAQRTEIEKSDVVKVVEAFMDVVRTSLADGENVYLRGFGSFIVKEKAEKMARNITKGTSVLVPAHKAPAFKAAPEFKDMVKEA